LHFENFIYIKTKMFSVFYKFNTSAFFFKKS